MKPGDYISVSRFHNGMRIDALPLVGLVLIRADLMPFDGFKNSYRIQLLETNGELIPLILDGRDEVEVLIEA